MVMLSVLADSPASRNRLQAFCERWLNIQNKFVGIAAARFTVERRAPLSEYLLQFFLRIISKLVNVFDPHRAQRSFCHFANAGNFPRRQLRQEARLLSRWYPQQTARFGLLAGNFCHQPS